MFTQLLYGYNNKAGQSEETSRHTRNKMRATAQWQAKQATKHHKDRNSDLFQAVHIQAWQCELEIRPQIFVDIDTRSRCYSDSRDAWLM